MFYFVTFYNPSTLIDNLGYKRFKDTPVQTTITNKQMRKTVDDTSVKTRLTLKSKQINVKTKSTENEVRNTLKVIQICIIILIPKTS